MACSSLMIDHFKQQVYDTYLRTLSDAHISARFPDMGLIEAFDNPGELALQSQHGAELLDIPTSQFGPHQVIETELAKQELKNLIV